MSDGVSSSPQFDLQTNVLLKIPSCGPPKIFFQMSAAACSKPCPLASVYLLNLTGEQWIRFHRTNFRSNPKGLVAYDLLLEPNFYIGNCKLFCLESFSLTNLIDWESKRWPCPLASVYLLNLTWLHALRTKNVASTTPGGSYEMLLQFISSNWSTEGNSLPINFPPHMTTMKQAQPSIG